MRVHFVNRFYWPAEPATAQLLGDLAEAVAATGAQTRIVTGRTRPDSPDKETHNGVEITRIGSTTKSTQSLVRRTIDFALFRAAAARELRRNLRPGDLVVSLTDPPLLGVTVQATANATGARLVHWVHDIYPEVFHAVTANPVSWFTGTALTRARNTAWRHAVACVTLGDDMANVIRDSGVNRSRVHVIPNWAPQGVGPATDEALRAQRDRWLLDRDKFVVGYSGNLGRVHDLDGLLDVAHALLGDAKIAFLFVGSGAAFARLQAAATERRLTNVRFLPPQPRSDLSTTLSIPDLHLISLRQGCERFVFPSKLYGVAAVGRPMLVLAPAASELSRVVTAGKMGGAFTPGATREIADFIRALARDSAARGEMSAAALRFHADIGGWDRARDSWLELLRKLDAAA